MEKTVAAMLPRRAKGADARLSLLTLATGRQLVRSQKRPIVPLPRSRPLGDVGSRCMRDLGRDRKRTDGY
jgi:hypothetical protein